MQTQFFESEVQNESSPFSAVPTAPFERADHDADPRAGQFRWTDEWVRTGIEIEGEPDHYDNLVGFAQNDTEEEISPWYLSGRSNSYGNCQLNLVLSLRVQTEMTSDRRVPVYGQHGLHISEGEFP